MMKSVLNMLKMGALSVVLSLVVFAQSGVVRAETVTLPVFALRIDDNHSPQEWRKMAEIFERQGIRCSFAVVSATLTDEQGACLRELAARGHALLDHTPNHDFYQLTYPDEAAFRAVRGRDFVADGDEATRTIFFKPVVDESSGANGRIRAKIVRNHLVLAQGQTLGREKSVFLRLPGRTEVFGLRQDRENMLIRDFWRRPLSETIDLDETEILVLGRGAIQPCDDVLCELAKASIERFAHHGLPRPTVLVHPGGWATGVAKDRIERIYGDAFGYVGADANFGGVRGATRWTTGYDDMYFFDQGADITPEMLLARVEKALASGKSYVLLTHLWGQKLPGGMDEFFAKTERFAALLKDRKIPTLTFPQMLEARFPIGARDELDRTATPPAPQRVELGKLNWRLPAGAELTEKGVLRIRVSESNGTAWATAPLDLAALSGRSVKMRIRAAGCDLAQPLLPYHGLKFMLKLTCADGKTIYPGAKHKAGSWQETVELSALLQDVTIAKAELVLGLEKCSGSVAFDTASLVLEDCGSPFERVNKNHRAVYTPSVLSRPRRRGVMSPMKLERLTEADFETLAEWGANLMRYQISKDWKSPNAWLDLDEYDAYVDEMLDILDRRVLPWATARGMSVVIDLHATPGARIKTLENRIFFEEKYFRHYLKTWEKIARRFKGRAGIYGYDLVNEPKQNVAAPHSYLHAQLAAARAIRAIDAEVPVLISSNDYDKPYTYDYLSPLTLTNVIYTVHAYPPNEYTHQGFGAHANKPPLVYPDAAAGLTKESIRKALQPVRDFELRHHAKIYVGEFSTVIWAPGAAQYLHDLIDIFEEYGWDWSYHAFRESRLWDVEKNWSRDENGKDVFTPATTDTPRLQELKRGFRLNAAGKSVTRAGIDFQAQIDAAAAAGGGRVVVPRGRHLTRELRLRSNVELHLEHGAWLEGSSSPDDYTFVKLPYSEGDWAAVVSAYNVTNVSITGTGTICGNGGAFPQMSVWSGDAGRRRPRGLFFGDCKGVRLEDFVLRDAAMWGIVFKCSEDVLVRGVTVDSAANLNNDGIDIEARNVVIRDCDIDCCDDAVCIKSNNPDFTVENILVSNVVARSQSNMLKIGTASHGTIRNILFTDCRVEAPRRDFLRHEASKTVPTLCFTRPERLNYMKGLRPHEMTGISGLAVENVDGGIVEDITFRNISVEGCAVPIFVRGGRRLKRKCGIPPSDKCVLRNILFENIVGSARSSIANSITGVEDCRVKNVTLRNVHLKCRGAGDELSRTARTETVRERPDAYPECNMFDYQILPAYCLYARHVDGLVMENVTDELQEGTTDLRERIVLDDVTDIRGLVGS